MICFVLQSIIHEILFCILLRILCNIYKHYCACQHTFFTLCVVQTSLCHMPKHFCNILTCIFAYRNYVSTLLHVTMTWWFIMCVVRSMIFLLKQILSGS
jgi:hypothetical protein